MIRSKKRYNYYNRCRCVQMWFNSMAKELKRNKALRKWTCACCIHRTDGHGMNCLECCPGERAIGGIDIYNDPIRLINFPSEEMMYG